MHAHGTYAVFCHLFAMRVHGEYHCAMTVIDTDAHPDHEPFWFHAETFKPLPIRTVKFCKSFIPYCLYHYD